jgi:hypothetical protein
VGASKVIVLDPEPRAGRQLLLGFAREGIAATAPPVDEDLGKLAIEIDGAGLVVVGGRVELVKRTRELVGNTVPIVFAGRGVRRSEAETAGADEVILAPAHLRDVVTIGRILHGVPANQRAHVVGSLAETTGVYTLVRALSAIGRSAVLTLIRGLRRGEVRFYHGEVTSAQVGLIHGQAALHQLLLWTDARYDYHHEDVVRRQQIPLTPDELFADAERFLLGVRDSAGKLSPAMVLEQDVPLVHSFGKQIPTEVHGVLRMFDGHRVLADVLEDSPYRVFETLRVAQRALEIGLLKIAPSPRPKATWKALLAIEEWLVGSETRDGVVERTAAIDSGPVSAPTATSTPATQKSSSRKARRKKKRANTPPPLAAGGKAEIDWGALVPRIVGAEAGPLAGVVPAMNVSGEIESRAQAREGLEAMTDPATRTKLFPSDAAGAAEPKVVWSEVADRAAADAEVAAKAEAEAEAKAKAKAKAKADEDAATAPKPKLDDDSATAPKAKVEPEPPPPSAAELVKQILDEGPEDMSHRVRKADPITVTEAGGATVTTTDTLTVVAAKGVAVVTSIPLVTITDSPATTAAPLTTTQVAAPAASAAPAAIADEISDGVIIADVGGLDTHRPRSRRQSSKPPENYPAPPAEARGEIVERVDQAAATASPPANTSRASQPSVLVADLAAAHEAIAAVAATQSRAPATSEASTPARDKVVKEVRKDAVAFSDAEEAFFRKADDKTGPVARPTPPVETFEDLDADYKPLSFWDRVRGKRQLTTASKPLAKPNDPDAPDKKK